MVSFILPNSKEREQIALQALKLARGAVDPLGISNPTFRTELEILHSMISHTSLSIDDKVMGKSYSSFEFTDPTTGTKWTASGDRLSIPGDPFQAKLKRPAGFELQREVSESKQALVRKTVTTANICVINPVSYGELWDSIGASFEELITFEYQNKGRDNIGRFLAGMPPTLEGVASKHSNNYKALKRTKALLREFRQALLSN